VSRVLFVVLAACSGREPAPAPVTPPAPPPVAQVEVGLIECERVDGFADETPVAEASGATWVTIDGKAMLVVTSDSGHQGAYALVDPETGATTEHAKWPLGGTGDDVEGLASRGDRVLGLTSAGFVRAWERRGPVFELVDGPYPLGTGDVVCDPNASNCGRNFEGLCLAPAGGGAGPCLGFALSKADGALICVEDAGDGRIRAKRDVVIPVGKGEVLADCAIDDRDRLWVGSNLFDLNTVYRVDGWRAPATAKVVAIGAYGTGFTEVIAVRGDAMYRMSDLGGSAPSAMTKLRCSDAKR